MLSGIPAPMRSLGLAGLIPFIGLAAVVIAGDDSLHAAALRAQIGYGAVIVSFLGALHWGAAVQTPALATWPRMSWGVTPSLLGWVALLLPPLPALVLLTTALLAALVLTNSTSAATIPVPGLSGCGGCSASARCSLCSRR